MKIFLIIVGILLIAETSDAGFGLRGGGYKGSVRSPSQKSLYSGGSTGNYAGSDRAPVSGNSATSEKSEARSARGLGISAWGIIGIIIGAVLLTTMGYYVFVLYPYLCKKQRSYDMIELTDVV